MNYYLLSMKEHGENEVIFGSMEVDATEDELKNFVLGKWYFDKELDALAHKVIKAESRDDSRKGFMLNAEEEKELREILA